MKLLSTLRALGISAALALCALCILDPAQAAPAVQVFSNNASATLATPLSSTSTTMTLTAGGNSLFPILTGGNWFIGTLQHIVAGAVTAQEIVRVTARPGVNMTIVRGQENTAALAWNAGDIFSLLPTAGGLNNFVQPAQAQAQGFNYAVDVGSAGSYVVALTPAVTSHVVGMPITFLAAHANTGGGIFNDGAGSGTIVQQNLSTLQGGEIQANSINTVVWDGTFFELTSSIGNAVLRNPQGGGLQIITGPIETTGSFIRTLGTNAFDQIWNTGAPTNQGSWIMQAGASTWTLSAYNDAQSASTPAFQAIRSGANVTSVILGGSAQIGTTQSISDNSTNFATTAFTQSLLASAVQLGANSTLFATPSFSDNSTKIATTAFVQALVATGSGTTNGSMKIPVTGAPNGAYIVKWGFHTPGTTAGAGLETISITGSSGAFPNHMYFAAAFSNRSATGVVGVGATLQSSLSTTQFQSIVDQDGSGNRSALWLAIGD